MKTRTYIQKNAIQHSDSAPINSQFQPRPFAIQSPQQVSPEPQETLNLQTQLERAKRFGYNFANISVSPASTTPLPIQKKLAIGESRDKYEQEADDVAAPVVNQINANIIQRVLLDPALEGQVSKNVSVYSENAVQYNSSKDAEAEIIGKLNTGYPCLVFETENPKWVKVVFKSKEKNKDSGQQQEEANVSAQLKGGQTIQDAFVRKSDIGSLKVDGTAVVGHGKPKDDPLFHTDENGQKSVRPEDVNQGGIGDCMLMAALVKLAMHEPNMILDMIEERDETVVVRFFRFKQGTKQKNEEKVEVRKTVLKKANTAILPTLNMRANKLKQTKRLGAFGTVLWPAMLEKAFAKFAGSYQAIAPGSLDPYECITGREIKREELFESVNVQQFSTLKTKIPKLSDPEYAKDLDKWQNFLDSKLSDLQDKYKIYDIQYNDMKWLLKKAGVSQAFADLIMKYYEKHFDGAVGSGDYSESTLAGFNKIKEILDRGEFVETGTRNWKGEKKGRGHSGGEDVDTVPGLASPHAYAVVGAETRKNKEGKDIHYIKVRNPWGTTGLDYDEHWKRKKITNPEFDLELSDARRFFGEATRNNFQWRYTEIQLDDLFANAEKQLERDEKLDEKMVNTLQFHSNKLAEQLSEQQKVKNKAFQKLLDLRNEFEEIKNELQELEAEENELSNKSKETVNIDNEYNKYYKKYKLASQKKERSEESIGKLEKYISGLTQEIEKIEAAIATIKSYLEN